MAPTTTGPQLGCDTQEVGLAPTIQSMGWNGHSLVWVSASLQWLTLWGTTLPKRSQDPAGSHR